MCGILALMLANPEGNERAYQLHEALYTLQHRGQDACGLATCASGGRIYQWKGNGRAEAVFKLGVQLSSLPCYMGLVSCLKGGYV
jgi:amidophosphoribosyltransferase